MKRRGFTLIELLVVIAIIAILAAILFPVFANAKERARQVKCLNNLKQLTQAFKSYCDDYNGIMPSICGNQSTTASTGAHQEWTGQGHSTWDDCVVEKGQLWKYTHNKMVYICPTDIGMIAAGIHNDKNGTAYPKGVYCTDYPLSYSVNCEMGSIYGAGAPDAFKNNLKLDVESAGRTGKILFLIHEAHWNKRLDPKNKQWGINDGYFSWKGTFSDVPDAIHYNGSTCSYVDGHVKWISFDQLQSDSDYKDANNNNPYSQWNSNSRRAQLGL